MSANENTYLAAYTTDKNIERIGEVLHDTLVGKVIEVGYISYYRDDENSHDHEGPFLVIVQPEDPKSYHHWNDDWYDPDWTVEVLPNQDVPADARSFVVSAVSCDSTTGRWELKFNLPETTEVTHV